MAARLTIFFAFSCMTAFAAHLFFGSIIFAAEQQDTFGIVLRDVYEKEMHELSGMVMVPSTCHDLSVRSKDFDIDTVFLVFETWEQSTRAGCERVPTPRAVHVITFAPENIQFKGLLDNEVVPIKIVRAN